MELKIRRQGVSRIGRIFPPGKISNFQMWTLVVYLSLAISSSKCQTSAALYSGQYDSSIKSELKPNNEPIRIKMLAPPTVSRKHTRTRQNSRFLRTFPPMELLNMAKQSSMDINNEVDPVMMNYNYKNRNSLGYGGSASFASSPYSPYPMKARIDAENSPIFYIKLPPVPYIFMPGVGYVSPHPYSNSPSMPMAMSSGQMIMPGMGSFIPSSSQESSLENQSVISLPLKFLSNGRPHQIESPKRKRRPGLGNKENSSENKGASLISGGKYSFNGRPTAVFVVRSPASRATI